MSDGGVTDRIVPMMLDKKVFVRTGKEIDETYPLSLLTENRVSEYQAHSQETHRYDRDTSIHQLVDLYKSHSAHFTLSPFSRY